MIRYLVSMLAQLHSRLPSFLPRDGRVLLLTALCFIGLAVPARAQLPQEPEDPEDEKQVGLWLDQGISADLSPDKSLEFEFHERFDEGASNLFEYFFQGGVAFRLRPMAHGDTDLSLSDGLSAHD